MFDLDKKTCLLTHCQGRHEKHGDENVLAADLQFVGQFDGDVLAEFHPLLRWSFYEKKLDGDLADRASDQPTSLRFLKLSQPLKWDAEIVGATVTLEYGLGDLVFGLADVNKFRIELHDGGTVHVLFRVQVHPTEDQLAKLFGLMDTNVPVTIDPPAVEEMKEAA